MSSVVPMPYFRASYSFNEFLSIRQLPDVAKSQIVTHANGMLNYAIIHAVDKEQATLLAKKISREWNARSFISRF